MQSHLRLALAISAHFVRIGLVLAVVMGGTARDVCADASRPAAADDRSAPSTPSRRAGCDIAHSLIALDSNQRQQIYRACVQGPNTDAATYRAIFRLVSSPGWHVGVIATILRVHQRSALTVWADGRSHRNRPAAIVAQAQIDAGLSSLATGPRCAQLRASAAMVELVDALDADEEPEQLPFNTEFASCMGVPAASIEGTRLLTIRADSLNDVTVVMGTREFVHARRFERKAALHLGSHRLFIIAVPEAAPVAVFANHENLRLPVIWKGLMERNTIVWAVPPHRSCLDLSVDINRGTHLYVDGVRIDSSPTSLVCDEPISPAGAPQSSTPAVVRNVDQTLAITLDRPTSGLPDHEIAALTCEGGQPVVRHLSPIAATAASDQLRRTAECESVRLDISTPPKGRVAVLEVAKLPGCETTPMWASDIQERIRHILGRDSAHRNHRTYANFSAYAKASEALSSFATQLGDSPSDDRPDRGADASTLLGSAAQQAWRQGIDTLLSLALQCTPRSHPPNGDPQWSYSLRATSIEVSDLFARGYYSREGIDLEDFIDVQSVGFTDVSEQDASLGALLDQVFSIDKPRFTPPPPGQKYRRAHALRLNRYFHPPSPSSPSAVDIPEEITIGYKAFHSLVLKEAQNDASDQRAVRSGPTIPRRPRRLERPRLCERLVHRGARPAEAITEAQTRYIALSDKEHLMSLPRSRDELDTSSNPRAAVYAGDLRPPRPGWYLITIQNDHGQIDDAICVHATAPAVDLWGDLSTSGGPLAYAENGSRVQFYLRPRAGVTWYAPNRWLGGGISLGYGYTRYAGTRGDWKDLDVPVVEQLQWQRHAVLLSPFVEVRTRTTALPVEFRARLGPTLDAGFVDLSQVDPALQEFRDGQRDDTVLDFDFDLNLDFIVGAPLGPVQLQGLIMLSYIAINDSLARSATLVTEDANLLVGFGLGISGGKR